MRRVAAILPHAVRDVHEAPARKLPSTAIARQVRQHESDELLQNHCSLPFDDPEAVYAGQQREGATVTVGAHG